MSLAKSVLFRAAVVVCSLVLPVCAGMDRLSVAQAAVVTGEPGLVGKTIVIDAGHGGPDSGARSATGLYEKDITLKVSLKLAELLRESGANVVLTRTTDDDLASDHDRRIGRRQATDLKNRVLTAKAHQTDAFVSVHCNAVTSERWAGAQVLYQRNNAEGEHLAKVMQHQFHDLLLPTARTATDTSTLYLLKRIPGPAVIAEIGFLSNPEESAQLVSPSYQRTVAFSIYLSLFEYFSQQRTVPVPNTNSSSA